MKSKKGAYGDARILVTFSVGASFDFVLFLTPLVG